MARRAQMVLWCAAMIGASSGWADEGQWMPEQVRTLAPQLKKAGFALAPDALWSSSPDALMRAVINLRGCSGAFITGDGLVATNHHCAYRALQEASTVREDLLTNGFYAATRADERPAPGLTVKMVQNIAEVTDELRAIIEQEQDPLARAEKVTRRQKELVAACEAKGDVKCEVAPFYRGARYQLITYTEFRDIRLVYAPPTRVGNFGGEVDNWMWPRHSADFTLVRAYVTPDGSPAAFDNANVPHHPRVFLTPSREGVTKGDFVATMGYPGQTNRYLSAVEVERHLTQVFPYIIELYQEWIRIQEAAAAGDKARELKIAGRVRSLANREKNSRGMVDGIVRMGLLDKRKLEDAALAALASKKGGDLAGVPAALQSWSDQNRAAFKRDLLLRMVRYGADALALAVHLVRWAHEAKKPDVERAEGYQDRDRDDLWSTLERHLKTYDPAVDTALLASWQKHVQTVAGAPEAAQAFAPGRIAKSPLMVEATVRALFEARDEDALRASKVRALALAFALVPWIEQAEAEQRARDGVELQVGPAYFQLLQEVRDGPVYPDANGTLRFSYATVRGYSPKDGLYATPQTTLRGMLAKHTGQDPFDLPAKLRKKAPLGPTTFWADPRLGDVPVCFLSSSDTTGGNSGSPVINRRGELVGFNFDRVWENIAGDFGYDISRSRNISVDVRYMYWLLDEVQGDTRLLEEMGLLSFADKPARQDRPRDDAGAPVKAGCRQADPVWVCGGLALGALLTWRRRRRTS